MTRARILLLFGGLSVVSGCNSQFLCTAAPSKAMKVMVRDGQTAQVISPSKSTATVVGMPSALVSVIPSTPQSRFWDRQDFTTCS